MMHFKIFTIFPEMFVGPLSESLLGKAQEKGILSFSVINFRDYAIDKHRHVDDAPFGGGAGMVLKPEPLIRAMRDQLGDLSEREEREIILLTPQGTPFDQAAAKALSQKKELAFICGHYEGFDERIRHFVTREYSIGDYVLTGGELPAMVIIDAVARLIPGVIKEQVSYEEDSFFDGLLEYPQYTRPRDFEGMLVPEVLFSGHHANIVRWQKKESLRRTLKRRPDLLAKKLLSPEEELLLAEIRAESDIDEKKACDD